MKEKKSEPSRKWSQSSPRGEMVFEILSLGLSERAKRLAIPFGKLGHIDDEVIVTMMLDAWKAGQDREADTYASVLLRRVTKHVRAHVRKNPGWRRFGGGSDTLIDDFCQETVLAILNEIKVPSHAEIAFGQYVYRRCLDAAGKHYAKKNSAGQSLDEDDVEAMAQASDPVDSSAAPKSPEEELIEIEELLAEQETLENIRRIVLEDMPELPGIAFSFRYFGHMKIESKNKSEVTVTSLMGVTEKTATKYINQAIEIIRRELGL